jgi:uncharacterized protein (TIGR00297 family)
MQGGNEDIGWHKVIPEARDRLQSRVLVWVVGALLLILSIQTLRIAYPMIWRFPSFSLKATGISLAFAFLVKMLRAAATGGAATGGMICFLIIFCTGSFVQSVLRSGLTPLILLFVLTFLSTRAGRGRKARAGVAEDRKGRNAAQVIANLSVAALSVTPMSINVVSRWMAYCCVSGHYGAWAFEVVKVMCMAALVEATADTVSSEIGQAFGGRPVMLLTLQRVDPGKDGAVTLLGSLAGVAGGVLVAGVGMWALRLHPLQAAIALIAGICGLFFDSFLGATVERRGFLGNDLVNFTSTVFAAALAALLYRFFAL